MAEENAKKTKQKVVKVPVVMQMEALECGAASLTMILAYYKKWIPLEQVRRDCGVSRDGSNAKNVLGAARRYGLSAKGYRCSLESVREMPLPAIIHWNFNHFVVLSGFKREKVVLNDPARGRVEVTMEEFDNAFTGVLLAFEPTDAFEPGGAPHSVMSFVRQRLRGTAAPMTFVVLTSFLLAAAGVIAPLFSRVFLDSILSGKNAEWLRPFLIGLLGLTAFQITVNTLNALFMLKIRGKLAITANATFMWHVLRLPVEFFSQRFAGDIAERQASNEGVVETLITVLAPMALNLLMILLYLIIMLRYSLLLTVIGVATAALNLWVTQFVSAKRINITRGMMRDSGKLASTTTSGIEMIETIKASGAESGFFERWAGYSARMHGAKAQFTKVNASLGMLPSIMQELANVAVLILGVYLILQGSFTVGMLLAFQGFLSQFMMPVSGMLDSLQTIQEMRSSMERVEDVLHYPTDVEYVDGLPREDRPYTKLHGRVELKNVTFGYSPLAEPLIRDFSLTLTPGKKVALVGGSGCGKSTIAKLVSGLNKPWSGEILFDGKPIDGIPREVFTASLAVVDQEITLFEDSIGANIRMWDRSIQDFEVILAANDARIHAEILEREGGYQTMVQEGGRNFSGGQRQRMEIARVLAQDPTIIIMDEATSALDAKTEFEVISAIKDRGVTCIIVAHRLSTIRDCDEIIVLDRGMVVERGTHEALYALGGQYTKLVTVE